MDINERKQIAMVLAEYAMRWSQNNLVEILGNFGEIVDQNTREKLERVIAALTS